MSGRYCSASKHPVERDLWILGAYQLGEEQHTEAVDSEVRVFQQLKGAIQFRDACLQPKGSAHALANEGRPREN